MKTETYDPRITPWQIDEADFYELESFSDQVSFLLRYTVLAPSSHNTQPWIFRIADGGVEVFADYSRRLPLTDPDDRELLLSVGAAITNLRVAAAWFGFETTVMYERRPEQSVPVAFVAIRETCATDEGLRALFPAIRKRHTNRKPFTDDPIAGDAVSGLCDAIDEYPDTLRMLRRQDRTWVADLVAEGERRLMARSGVRAELADWLRPAEGGHYDGMCTDTLGIRGPFAARRDRERIEDAAALVTVTASDDRVSLVQAGEILERLLLTITRQGLQYSFLNQAVEVPELRSKLQDLTLSSRPPQLLVCVGSARETKARPAPRRPMESVVV